MPEEYKHNRQSRKHIPTAGRGLVLYLIPIPLVFMLLIQLFQLKIPNFLLTGGITGLFYYAAHLNWSTFRDFAEKESQGSIQKAKDNRMLAMIVLGVAVFLCTMFLVRRPFLIAGFLSLLSMVGYYLVYGLKKQQTVVDFDALPQATRKILEEATEDVERIQALGQQAGEDDAVLRNAVDSVVAQSYKILSLLAKTPEDTGRARRFLSVYLNRIKEILEQYGRLKAHGRDDAFRDKILGVLNETDKAFKQKASNLLDDDVFKLDVQLDVLKDQINKEG